MNEIVQQGSIDALKNKHIKITWNLISFCNFHCPYCLDKNSKRNIYYQTEDQVKFAIDNLLSMPFNSFEFYLLGGEPTLYPHLDLVINLLLKSNKVKRIYIMTNGSNNFSPPSDSRLITIVSVHPLSITKIQNWNNSNTYYNLLAYPKVFDLVKKIYDMYKIDEITVVRKPPNFEYIYNYTDDQKRWILENDQNQIKPTQLYHGKWKYKSGEEEIQPKYFLKVF